MKFIKSQLKQKGFTLTEALVVVFIIGLISSILIVNWRKNEKQYQVQRVAQEIVQNIRKTQDMALNSFKYQEDDGVPDNYGIYFDKTLASSYIIFADENGNNKYNGGENIETILIDSGVEIGSLSSEPKLNITFSLPDAFTVINPAAVSATITIKKSDGICPQNCKNIIIRNTGQISVEDL